MLMADAIFALFLSNYRYQSCATCIYFRLYNYTVLQPVAIPVRCRMVTITHTELTGFYLTFSYYLHQ
ncbi:MAG: hypothetical protein JWR61_1447 [Ferruginibacter sp.]|nr:hypothetical protein [Ferruginibacter sp.]